MSHPRQHHPWHPAEGAWQAVERRDSWVIDIDDVDRWTYMDNPPHSTGLVEFRPAPTARTQKESPMTSSIDHLRADAQRALLSLAEAQALEDRFPSEPPDGSIVKWTGVHGSGRNRQEYTYAALRIGDTWYITGTQGRATLSWGEVRESIGTKPCWLATEFAEIPQPQKAAADLEADPAKWYALVYPTKAVESGESTD